jgi:hypothetical protein
MHAIAKRGLALVAATSGLVLGTATFAAADATTTAETSHSGGAAAGWTAQAPVNVPVNLCGDNVQAAAIKEMLHGTTCTINPDGTADMSSVDQSGGIGAGNQVQAAWSSPVLFCGWNVNGAALKDQHMGSTCAANADGPGASATAAAVKSGGIASGNIVQAGVNVPIDFCGNDVTLGTVKNVYEGSTCTN